MRRRPALGLLVLALAARLDAADPLADYQRLLATTVRDAGIDYRLLADGRAALDAYVVWLRTADPGSTPDDRAAFWVNAYNALMLKEAVDGRPAPATVAGREVTAEAIEMSILAKESEDPFVYLALHRASRTSPPLSAVLYRGEDLREALRQQARSFLSNAELNRFRIAPLSAELAMVFHRHRDEFGAGREGVVPPLQLFLADALPAEMSDVALSLRTRPWRLAFRPDDSEPDDIVRAAKKAVHPLWIALYAVAAAALLLIGFRAFRALFAQKP